VAPARASFVFLPDEVNAVLLPRDGRRRFKGNAKVNFLAVEMPPWIPAEKIRARHNAATAFFERIVVLRFRAWCRANPEPISKPLVAGKLSMLSRDPLQFVENGLSQSGGNVARDTFNYAPSESPAALIFSSNRLSSSLPPYRTTNDRGFNRRRLKLSSVNL